MPSVIDTDTPSTRSVQQMIRYTPLELRELRAAAVLEGLSVAAFVRRAGLLAARRRAQHSVPVR